VDQSCPECYACFFIGGVQLKGRGSYDNFGQKVAISANGNRVVGVGNAFVRVYDKMGDDDDWWSQQLITTDLDLGGDEGDEDVEYDFFSGSIALSSDGHRVAMGAKMGWYDKNVEKNASHYHEVCYVRVFDVTDQHEWTQVGLDLECGSVALSSDGNRIAIGGQQSDDDDLGASILVRIFDWTGSQWTQVGSTLYDDVAEGYATVKFATLGGSIALSSDGNFVAVGSIQEASASGDDDDDEQQDDDTSRSRSGQVRVFEWMGSDWTQVGSDLGSDLLPHGGINPWEVGLSSDGTRIIMTAPGEAGVVEESELGSVLIYDLVVSTAEIPEWIPVDFPIEYDYDLSTVTSVVISSDGNHVVVGIASNNLVLHYAWTGRQWTRRQPDVRGDDGGSTTAGLSGEMFGSSVALSSSEGYHTHLVVGAPQDSNVPRSGSMRIFDSGSCVPFYG
jgi:hypothetical protein